MTITHLIKLEARKILLERYFDTLLKRKSFSQLYVH